MADTEKELEDNIQMGEFLPGVFRYIVLAVLYVISFLYIRNNSTQFIIFIVAFILNFFTIIFLVRDFISVPDLSDSLLVDSAKDGSGFTKLFAFAIIITLVLNIATFGIVLAVFDYGKKSTNNYLSYTMTPQNMELMDELKSLYFWYMLFIGFFAFFIIYSHVSGRLKLVLQNFIGIILSCLIIVIASYNCSLAVKFLGNLRHKRQLYQ
jgi:hypothetical protein